MSRRKVVAVDTRTRILDAALSLIRDGQGADVKMEEIASAAGISRQAVYLHFADRGDLLVALVRRGDEMRGLEEKLRVIREAPNGLAAAQAMVALQAEDNPQLWAVARIFDASRRVDPAVERSWQDRLRHRLEGCHGIVKRIAAEGALRPGLDTDSAADLLWTLTSLRMWEDLVVLRNWSACRYRLHVGALVQSTLADNSGGNAEAKSKSGSAPQSPAA